MADSEAISSPIGFDSGAQIHALSLSESHPNERLANAEPSERGLDDLGVCPRRLASRPATPTPSSRCGSCTTGLQWRARRKARKKDGARGATPSESVWGARRPGVQPSRRGTGVEGQEKEEFTRPAVPTSRLGAGCVAPSNLAARGRFASTIHCTSVWERKRARIVRFW